MGTPYMKNSEKNLWTQSVTQRTLIRTIGGSLITIANNGFCQLGVFYMICNRHQVCQQNCQEKFHVIMMLTTTPL